MSVLKVKVRNMGRLQSSVKKLDWTIKASVVRALRSLVEALEDEARSRILTGAKTGRLYHRSNPRRLHQASAPGQSPANDSGKLAASIEADVDPKEFNLNLSAGAAAKELEYGTHKMAPRPFLVPTILAFRRRFADAIYNQIKGDL